MTIELWHYYVTYEDGKTISNLFWLFLLIIHLCKVDKRLIVWGEIKVIGLYQCHCMAESCWHLPLACLGLDITVKEIGTCSALWSIICSLHRIFFRNILKILFKEERKLFDTMQTSFCDLSWHTASFLEDKN